MGSEIIEFLNGTDKDPADWFEASPVDWTEVDWDDRNGEAGRAWIAHFSEDGCELDVTIVLDDDSGKFGGRVHYNESSTRHGASIDVEVNRGRLSGNPDEAFADILERFSQVLSNASKVSPRVEGVMPAPGEDNVVSLSEMGDDESDDQAELKKVDEADDGIDSPPDHPDPDHAFNDPNFRWSDSQKRAILEARDFLADDSRRFYGIYGAAGTGKTAVIQYICDEFDGSVALTAPTHKAAGVLSEMALGFSGTSETTTIHSLLNMRKQRKGGREFFAPEGGNVPDVAQDLLVIDECSMIDEDLWGWVEQAQSQSITGLKVICMGDPYQLPPVNESMSPSFDVQGVELKEIVRHGGIIKETANEIRLDIGKGGPIVPEAGSDEDGEIITYDDRSEWIDRAAECAGDDEIDTKILAYTNNEVDNLNSEIRRRIIGEDAPAFVTGETLVAVSTFTQKEMGKDGEEVVMYTEDRCEVLDATPTTEHQQACWWLKIAVEPAGDVHQVYAVTRPQWKNLDQRLSRLAKQEEWGEFWKLKDEFVRLRAPYATTVHKGQGSSFGTVFVHQDNLFRVCNETDLRDRLSYVACSRAVDELHLLDRDNYGLPY